MDNPNMKNTNTLEIFSTGACRDNQEDKARYDLIPTAALRLLAAHYASGSKIYGEKNWTKGMPYSRVIASLLRHVYQFIEGDSSERHDVAIAWNAFALITYQEWIRAGKLPPELDDRHLLNNPESFHEQED